MEVTPLDPSLIKKREILLTITCLILRTYILYTNPLTSFYYGVSFLLPFVSDFIICPYLSHSEAGDKEI
jgi:hypothetical protein